MELSSGFAYHVQIYLAPLVPNRCLGAGRPASYCMLKNNVIPATAATADYEGTPIVPYGLLSLSKRSVIRCFLVSSTPTDFLATILLELPVSVVQRADLSCLQPA